MKTDLVVERMSEGKCPICGEVLNPKVKYPTTKYQGVDVRVHSRHHIEEKV